MIRAFQQLHQRLLHRNHPLQYLRRYKPNRWKEQPRGLHTDQQLLKIVRWRRGGRTEGSASFCEATGAGDFGVSTSVAGLHRESVAPLRGAVRILIPIFTAPCSWALPVCFKQVS